MMNITIASNWDPGLINKLDVFPLVKEVFGVMQKTPVGSGRPYFIVANPDEKEVMETVAAVHASGRKFNYLLNGPCMNNMEYDKKTHRQLLDHINTLQEIGVDSVTVSIPYLLEIIKKQFPSLEVRVSVIAHVNSVQRAKFFEDLGADAITLDANINRDFHLLKEIRKAVGCGLSLIVNDPCLYQCPYRYYHYNLLAHSTQTHNPLEGFYIDYCIVRCTMKKYTEPTEIIKSRWIRPEDIRHYEEIGMDTFKISGRRMSTEWLLNTVQAYSRRSYKGNLFDLLNCVTPGVDPDIRSPQYQVFLEKTEFLKREKLIALGQLYPVKPYIDNSALDGFIDFFRNKNCLTGCATCNYCQQVADSVIRLDAQQATSYTSALGELLDDLTGSRIFEDSEDTTTNHEGEIISAQVDTNSNSSNRDSKIKIEWDQDTYRIFEKIISKTPEAFRDIAYKTVKKRSETNASERSSAIVESSDMIHAFLTETPAAFRADMLAGLKSQGLDPG